MKKQLILSAAVAMFAAPLYAPAGYKASTTPTTTPTTPTTGVYTMEQLQADYQSPNAAQAAGLAEAALNAATPIANAVTPDAVALAKATAALNGTPYTLPANTNSNSFKAMGRMGATGRKK